MTDLSHIWLNDWLMNRELLIENEKSSLNKYITMPCHILLQLVEWEYHNTWTLNRQHTALNQWTAFSLSKVINNRKK